MQDSRENGSTDGLDPATIGVLRWAWANAKQWRAQWWLGGVLFGVVGIAAGFMIPGTWGNGPERALIAFGAAVVVVMVSSLAYALLSALHQQRNDLRRRLSKEAASGREHAHTRDATQPEISQTAQAGRNSLIIQAGRDVQPPHLDAPPEKRNTDDE